MPSSDQRRWRTVALETPAAATACSPNLRENRPIEAASTADAERHDGGQRAIIAKHGVRGPPECAVRIGRMRQHPIRLQGGKAGQAAGGKYRGDLQADNEAAPITAATICATSRVRLAPIIRNSAMVSASAAAVATAPMAATTP